MAKVFEYKAGSLLDRVSGQQLTNSGVVFKQTEKGVAGYFNVGNSITLAGVDLDVINIISNLKGNGTLRIAVGSNNIDIITTNLWEQVISTVTYTNETSITLSCISGSFYLQGVKLFDKLLDTYEINKEYKKFLALQNMRVAKTNFYYPNGIQDNDVIFYDDFRYENTDGTNVIPNDWLTGTGLFKFSEIDLNTKVLECTSAGTVSHLYNKYNYVGGGLLEFDYFDGTEWLHYTDTVDELILSTSILSYASNKISYNLNAGDKIKNIIYAKGIGDRKEVFGFWVNGSTSFDPKITASEICEFDFGDGTSETTTNSPTHAYADTEDYLVKIYLSDLGLVTSLDIYNDSVTGTLDLSRLARLGGHIGFQNNPNLIGVINPISSETINQYYAHACNLTGTLDIGGLTRLGGAFYTNNNPNLTKIINPTSSEVLNQYYAYSCNLTGTLDISGLTGLGGVVAVYNNPNLTQIINTTSSETFNRYDAYSCNLTGIFDLSGLTRLGGGFRADNNPNLTQIINPISSETFEYYWTQSCNLTGTLDLSGLTNVEKLYCHNNNIDEIILNSEILEYIDFSNNNMTSAQVDQVWINLDNSTTQIDGYADGIDNDAPTSASQSARDNLETNGWTLIL